MINKREVRAKRAQRNRYDLKNKSNSAFRLSVFKSSKHIYAQIIDIENQKTLYSSSSLDKTLALKKGSDKQAAFKVGEFIAEKALKDSAFATNPKSASLEQIRDLIEISLHSGR